MPIVGDVKQVLQALNKELKIGEDEAKVAAHEAWLTQIKAWQKQYALRYNKQPDGTLPPQQVLKTLNELLQGDAVIVTDVGQHQMWAAQYFTYRKPNSIVTSGGAGTMGFGLPAAIGAQVGMPKSKVVLVAGDGGFQMTAHELMIINQYKLPVKIVLLNNSYLGMVRQWQELF